MQLKLEQSNKKENAAKTKTNLEAQTQMVYYSV